MGACFHSLFVGFMRIHVKKGMKKPEPVMSGLRQTERNELFVLISGYFCRRYFFGR